MPRWLLRSVFGGQAEPGGLEHSGLAAFGSAVAALLTSRGVTPGLAIALAAYVFLLMTPVFVALHRQFMLVVRPGRHAADMSVLTGAEFLAGLAIAANAGWIAQTGGYALLFGLSSLSALAGMLLAWRRLDEKPIEAT
jgi:hypothetical protein